MQIKDEPVETELNETRRRKRARRTITEIEDDIEQYHQLIIANKDLDKDIPPRKFNVKAEPMSEYIAPAKQTRSRTKKKEPIVEVALHKLPSIKRPSYNRKARQPQFKKTSSVQKNDTAPQPIDKISHFDSFENQVVVQNTYSDLIKLVNSSISKNPEEGAIDISLHHRLFSKNLSHEMLKFEVPINNSNNNTNPLTNSSIFNSGDIDIFFDNLNGGGNSQELIRDGLKRSIPLI